MTIDCSSCLKASGIQNFVQLNTITGKENMVAYCANTSRDLSAIAELLVYRIFCVYLFALLPKPTGL